eukprot:gene11336-12351_t
MRRIAKTLIGYSSYKYTLPLVFAVVGAATFEKENERTNFKFPNPVNFMPQTTFYSSPKRYFVSYCEENAQNNVQPSTEEVQEAKKPVEDIVIEDMSEEEDKKWEEEKQHCSFCRSFLQSPCKEPFKKWSRCVDRAKDKDVDFIEACQTYTRALMNCTKEHEEYFSALRKQVAEQSEDEEDDSEQGEEEEESDVREKEEGDVSREDDETVETQTQPLSTTTTDKPLETQSP